MEIWQKKPVSFARKFQFIQIFLFLPGKKQIESMETIQAKIILVDDNPAVLQATRHLLLQTFRTVLSVQNPTLLPALLREGDVDVVLLDMNFGKGQRNGADGLFWLRQITGYAAPPSVILITAYGDVPLAVESLKSGAVDFIQKPWDNGQLTDAVLRAFRRRQEVCGRRDGAGQEAELSPEELLLRALWKKYAEMYARPLPRLTDGAVERLSLLLRNQGLAVLENVIERSVLLKDSDCLDSSDFPEGDSGPSATTPLTLEEMEKQFIAAALKAKERNLTLVSQELGISRQTLYNKMRKYNL